MVKVFLLEPYPSNLILQTLSFKVPLVEPIDIPYTLPYSLIPSYLCIRNHWSRFLIRSAKH